MFKKRKNFVARFGIEGEDLKTVKNNIEQFCAENNIKITKLMLADGPSYIHFNSTESQREALFVYLYAYEAIYAVYMGSY